MSRAASLLVATSTRAAGAADAVTARNARILKVTIIRAPSRRWMNCQVDAARVCALARQVHRRIAMLAGDIQQPRGIAVIDLSQNCLRQMYAIDAPAALRRYFSRCIIE